MKAALSESTIVQVGDVLAVTRIVHVMYDRAVADPTLRPFFEDRSVAWLKSDFRDFLVQQLGGPRLYGKHALDRAAHTLVACFAR